MRRRRNGSAGEESLRGVGLEPAALLGDADLYDVVLAAVDSIEYGVGGAERDFVFAALAAEEDADAELLFHVSFSLGPEAVQRSVLSGGNHFRYLA